MKCRGLWGSCVCNIVEILGKCGGDFGMILWRFLCELLGILRRICVDFVEILVEI